jgi:hypothetical protein
MGLLGSHAVDMLLPVVVAVSVYVGIDGIDVLLFLFSVALTILAATLPDRFYTSARDLREDGTQVSHSPDSEEEEEDEEEEEEAGERSEAHEGAAAHAHTPRRTLRRSLFGEAHGDGAEEPAVSRYHVRAARTRPRAAGPKKGGKDASSTDVREERAKSELRRTLAFRRRCGLALLIAAPFVQFAGLSLIRMARTQHGFLMSFLDPTLFLVLSLLRLLFTLGHIGAKSNEELQAKLQSSRQTIAALQAKVSRLVEEADTSSRELLVLRADLRALRNSVEVSE